MSRRMVSTTVYVTQEQLDALKQISADTGVPQAVLVRQGIDLMRAECARKAYEKKVLAEQRNAARE